MMFRPNLYKKLEKLREDLKKEKDIEKAQRIAERITIVQQKIKEREDKR